MNQETDPAAQPAPEFATHHPEELLDRLAREEDRAPMELIDACVARGEAMVESLGAVVDDEDAWSGDEPGEWWLLLHAALILGRISSESAGFLLVRLMRNMDEYGDENLQDWVAGDWPALFANKPPEVFGPVRELARDGSCDWYIRCQAVDVVLAAGLRGGGQALEDAIDWAAALARDEADEWLFRISTACTLLDFPRSRHRELLKAMAHEERRRQAASDHGFVGMFVVQDVESAFARNRDEPGWRRRGDPWRFYTADAIADRQQRWRKEAEYPELPEPDWTVPVPYVRPTPKIGRNDPCPCGSGKKYKRCCLARVDAAARGVVGQTWH